MKEKKTPSQLHASYAGILDTGLLIDNRIKIPPSHVSLLLKVALLTSRHVYIPSHFISTNASVITVLNSGEFEPLFKSIDVDDYSPLVVGFKKHHVGIINDIKYGMASDVYGLVNEKCKAIQLTEKHRNLSSYYTTLGTDFENKIQHLDEKFLNSNNGISHEISTLDRGDYKTKALGSVLGIINQKRSNSNNLKNEIFNMADEFYNRIENEDPEIFSRSMCINKLDDICNDLKITKNSKTAFHQICLNEPHQQNIVKTDQIHRLVQGTPMMSYLQQILDEYSISMENQVEQIQDREEEIRIIKRSYLLSTMKRLTIDHILQIRQDNTFKDNILDLMSATKNVDEKIYSHIDYLVDKIQDLEISPHENFLKEQKYFKKISKISKIYDFLDNATSELQTTILSNFVSQGAWSYLPVIGEAVTLVTKSFFLTNDLLNHLQKKQMWNDWYSAITFSLNPRLQ